MYTSEQLATIITLSVLVGLVVIAIVAVCCCYYFTNTSTKSKHSNQQYYEHKASLEKQELDTSYVSYPAPEPLAALHGDEYDPRFHDQYDHGLRRSSFTDINGPPENIHGMPWKRRSSYSRRLSHAPSVPPKPSQRQRKLSHSNDVIRRSSYTHGTDRRPSLTSLGMPPRPASALDTLFRPTNLPNIPRRPSQAQGFELRPTNNKLWYFRLTEEPDYYSPENLENNMKQPRVWPPPKPKKSPSMSSYRQPELQAVVEDPVSNAYWI